MMTAIRTSAPPNTKLGCSVFGFVPWTDPSYLVSVAMTVPPKNKVVVVHISAIPCFLNSFHKLHNLCCRSPIHTTISHLLMRICNFVMLARTWARYRGCIGCREVVLDNCKRPYLRLVKGVLTIHSDIEFQSNSSRLWLTSLLRSKPNPPLGRGFPEEKKKVSFVNHLQFEFTILSGMIRASFIGFSIARNVPGFKDSKNVSVLLANTAVAFLFCFEFDIEAVWKGVVSP